MVRGYDSTTGVTVSGGVGEMGELNLGSRGLGIIFFSLSIIDLLKQIIVLFLIYWYGANETTSKAKCQIKNDVIFDFSDDK